MIQNPSFRRLKGAVLNCRRGFPHSNQLNAIVLSAISTILGVNRMPRLYPVCFIGYGVAAVVGPGVGGWMVDRFGLYTPAFALSAILLAGALICAFLPGRDRWKGFGERSLG